MSCSGTRSLNGRCHGDSDAVSAYSWNGTELTSIESSLSDGVCTFADEKACNFVVLNPNGAYEWLSKTSADSETQIFSTISISTVHEFAEGWLGFAELHASKGEMDGGVRYNVVWKNTASEGKFNFAPSSMKVTFTIPADEGQAIYLIQDSGTSRLAKKVAVVLLPALRRLISSNRPIRKTRSIV